MKDEEVLTGVNGWPWKANQNDKKKEEDEIEEKVDTDTEPLHRAGIMEGDTRVIVNEMYICLPKPILLIEAPDDRSSSDGFWEVLENRSLLNRNHPS